MALKRLPNDVQALLSASSQVNNFKRAIEELVYNSIDAESTSIAIRIHIQESTYQVIDNGYGIAKNDLNVLGQRYMTSKVTDLSTLKLAPEKYGFRGEFLANIIAVAEMVKITSRHENTQETWTKAFHNGKKKKFTKITTRPTKGTTVDVKGFLYNQNIQKRGINSINEIQSIRLFLEQLSLVHKNISISLRDDSKNEIVFKIHKNRDIYQTLSTLFNIGKAGVQELQVEKKEYKVKGFIGKTEIELNLHWIYLNGHFIHSSSKLHKIINDNFKKVLLINDQRNLKSKKTNDEHRLFNQNIPFYFVFIKCPYIDYDINHTVKQSAIEFKNWEHMDKLLEKLVKFYVGDNTLKDVKKNGNTSNKQPNQLCNEDTRNQVKKIMDKILGKNSKKLGVSQLQNGVKGKLVKRKKQNKAKKIKLTTTILKSFSESNNKNTLNENPFANSILQIRSVRITSNSKKIANDCNEEREHKKLGITKNQHTATVPRKLETAKSKTTHIQKRKKDTKVKNISPGKKTYKTIQQRTINRHKKLKVHKHNKNSHNLKETDSVCKKSKIVAQQVEIFLQDHTRNIKANRAAKKTAVRKNNQTKLTRNVYNHAINNIHVPRAPTANGCIINKYIMNTLKTNSFKTTYDLVQTILTNQEEISKVQKTNTSKVCYSELPVFDDIQNDVAFCTPGVSKRSIWSNEYNYSEYSDMRNQNSKMSLYSNSEPVQCNTYEYQDSFSIQRVCNKHEKISEYRPSIQKESKYICKVNHNFNPAEKQTPYNTFSGTKLTYESHRHTRNGVFEIYDSTDKYTASKRQNVRFITTQSRNNFITVKDTRNRFKKSSKSIFNKLTKLYDMPMDKTMDKLTFSKSNEINDQSQSNILVNNMEISRDKDYFANKTDVQRENELSDNVLLFGNTYSIQPNDLSYHINIETQYITSSKLFDTYTIQCSDSEINNDMTPKTISKGEFTHLRNNHNIVFVSESVYSESENNNIEPLNVCETVFHGNATVEREFAYSFNEKNRLNDTLYDSNDNISSSRGVKKTHTTENISHHFGSVIQNDQPIVFDKLDGNLQESDLILKRIENDDVPEDLLNPNIEGKINVKKVDYIIDLNHFNFKNRLRFVPKGMSQIFENCCSKNYCNYNLEKDYYEDSIYNNFANDVHVNAEIYESVVQNVEDQTTKYIHKFQNKVKKENASLVFDEKSLKEAKVLGQVDYKFIAAILRKRDDNLSKTTEYLILFDQHAVHERIRLEKNLADYINEDRWSNVPLDNIVMKMSKDEILYLHNYKDKFNQLGLQWTVLYDNEITINSIPEAILGKNPREVETIIKAVRNLIVEEINVLKLQKGCFSLYPKSVMDLVFSEACRYAIKFGDQLSNKDCVELLNELSDCKTPFQCAHGRPVMAVLMDIKYDIREYKVIMAKIRQFKGKSTANPNIK